MSEAYLFQQYFFHCPVAAINVTICRQTFRVSAIGRSTAIVRTEHDCSHATSSSDGFCFPDFRNCFTSPRFKAKVI
jgi:hypothetical protein